MNEVLLGTDVLLQAIIGRAHGRADELIEKARHGDIEIQILHSSICWALYSVREGDEVNVHRLAELIRYAQILPDAPEYLGPEDREVWTPDQAEVDNWRKCALQEESLDGPY